MPHPIATLPIVVVSLPRTFSSQLDTHKKGRIVCFHFPLLTEVGQLPADPATERALVVVVLVAATLTTLALTGGGTSSGVGVSSRGVGISAVLATALTSIATLSLRVVATGLGRSWLGEVDNGGLGGGLLDDGVRDVEDLLDALVGGQALLASGLLVGGDGGGQVLLVLCDLLLNTVEGLCRLDLGGDVCLLSAAGLLDSEASTEGTGQGVVSATDCADVSS